MPGVVGVQGTGPNPRFWRKGAKGREGLLEEVTPELGVNQLERERRDHLIHTPQNHWLLGSSKGRL